MKQQQTKRGFTIVELLIVIVIIGILAAITIVAYNGAQNRAKTAAGQSLANSVAKKVEIYNTIQGSYPSYTQLTDGTAPAEAKLDNTTSVIDGSSSYTITSGTAANGTKVVYKKCTTAGAKIGYFDYANNTGPVTVTVGDTTTC